MRKMLSSRPVKAGAVALALGLSGAGARADVLLNPGASGVPLSDQAYNNGAGPVAPGAVEVASTTIAVDLNPGSGMQGTTITEEVFRETGGTLDFLYQVNNTAGTEPISSLSLTNFNANAPTPFTTNVGYTTTLPTQTTAAFTSPGTVAPITADRTPAGAQVTFNFGAGGIGTGTLSNVFYVRTNASAFDKNGTVQASGTDSNIGAGLYEPTGTAVPEPGTFSLMAALGTVFGAGALVRRRNRA